jgi:secretion/DNA translocation related TadE-like protein
VTRVRVGTGRAPEDDAGSATVWVLGGVLLVVGVLTATLVRDAAVLARHRAESAADLAALAAAGRIGTSGPPCAAAETLAGRNRARLVECTVRLAADGRSGTVVVRVSEAVTLPVVGGREVTASARAGRLPASGPGAGVLAADEEEGGPAPD